MTIASVAWHGQALCAQIGGDLWHPDDAYATARAVALCRTCPVAADCLDYAMTVEPPGCRHGVWGGLTPTQRTRLYRNRNHTRQENTA